MIGGLPFGFWFVRLSSGRDIRTMGSGNIGATNVHRTQGAKAGLTVLLLDILKGFLAVLLAAMLTESDPIALALAAAAVMVGHCYPVLLNFKGGKAVACFVGAFLYIAPVALLIIAVLFAAAVAMSGYISMGSLLGAALFPLVVWLTMHPPWPILCSAVFAGVLVIYRHRANITRLANGTENKFHLRGGKR
jgi:glycerol-3-phosphate acyltransferase PlsY